MKPVFPRINKAIEFTLEYHTKGRIIEYLQAYTRIAKGNSSGSYLVDNWENLLYTIQENMEQEIIQTVYTSNQNTQVLMFEELREWIEIDWRLAEEPSSNFIWKVIDDYNEKIDTELNERLEIEVTKFQSTEEYKTLGENEEYEKTTYHRPIWNLSSKNIIPYTEKIINRKYYCNNLSTDYLDYYQFNKYKELVSRIVNNFRRIVKQHLSLFDAGKYISLSEITILKELIKSNTTNEKLIEAPLQPDKVDTPFTSKIDVNLNLEQLLYLFKALHTIGVIKNKNYTEIFDVLSIGFQLATKKPGENISKSKMANTWNKIEAKHIGYWKDKFIELMNQAMKDNPNNIKYNG